MSEIIEYGVIGLFFVVSYGLTLRFLTAIFGEEKE